jgi:hypothetical protein
MRKRDVWHFSPDPVGEAMANLLYHFTVDTDNLGPLNPRLDPYTYGKICEHRRNAEEMLRGVALLEHLQLGSFHVTDDPSVVIYALDKKLDLMEQRSSYGEICGGLYVSLEVGKWESVSRKKWDFLEGLGAEAKKTLYVSLRNELFHEAATHYITASEYDYALKNLDHWLNEGNPFGVVNVANQPYNINVQHHAKKTGVAEPFVPIAVKVEFKGRYLDLSERPANDEVAYLAAHVLEREENSLRQYDVCKVLRQQGWDGAFTRSGHSSARPELVIWNGGKIIRFGEWTRG